MRSPDHMARLASLRSARSARCLYATAVDLLIPPKIEKKRGVKELISTSDAFFILSTLSQQLQSVYCFQGGVAIALGSWIADPYIKKCPLTVVAPEALGIDV